MRTNALVVLASAALLALGCESEATTGEGNGGDTDTDADGDSDGDADTDADADADGDGDTDTETDVCAEYAFDIEVAPVNVMILQDMSYSMVDPDVANPTNWSYTLPALNSILTDWADTQLRFGLDIFPDGSAGPFQGCKVDDPVLYDCGDDTEAAILGYLNDSDNAPNGASTPLYCGMADFIDVAGYAPEFNDASANRYLVVFSDGEDFCGEGCCTGIGGDCNATADEFATLTQAIVAAGIKVAVIGFGSGVSPAQLTAIANNGGMDPPFDEYMIANDTATLEAALTSIANAVVTCVYNIEAPEEIVDPNDVNFYFDGDLVYWDPGCADGSGWTWTNAEQTQVEFCDGACALLQGGDVEEISATWGCPSVPIE